MTAPQTPPTDDDVVDPDGLLGEPTDTGSEPSEEPEPTAQLGDAGKKALDEMKAKWKAERDRAKALEQQLAAATKTAPKEGEPDLDAIRAEASKAANHKANERILRSEVRAAATGKLANPLLALRLLDLDQFEVDDDGNVDNDEISEAITRLIEENPGLGVTQGEPKRFKGSADTGAKAAAGKPQLTDADVKRLYKEPGGPAKIEAARLDGRLDKLLGITTT